MSIVRIIAFTIISSLILLEKVQTGIAYELTIEKYLGVWFEIGRFVGHKSKTQRMTCEWFNAKLYPQCGTCFKETYGNLPGGIPSSRKRGYGSIDNSTSMSISYPELRIPPISYEIIKSEHEGELLLHDRTNTGNSKLLSRIHTSSAAMKLQFELIAVKHQQYAIYVDPDDCAPLL